MNAFLAKNTRFTNFDSAVFLNISTDDNDMGKKKVGEYIIVF